ncbi:hypothetical protein CMQ_1261 [Grosmannia clavigera kw1407]|uniref:Uncharacterized protein n=1 Tax=Grosmannia clavigera (strain kw1407 / UAMH 11150) TaxID=655863 RepID=F0XE44_GROCL|nr:uncharacterized protein CMQ_1261 [Grosmannia clavigera kw1407]EFX04333.1 hypothetical protein CMQ_1261 [Grosmannia clavigera kw1407]
MWTRQTEASSGATTPAKEVVLPDLAPPSDDEAKGYYRRLPSCPRLVGRTSGKERWYSPFPGESSLPSSEEISTIGQHTIVSLWEDLLESHVMTIIKDLPWTSVDVLRIGLKSVKRSDKPVIVWIGVSTADIPWPKIADVLRAFRVVLDMRGLNDVDVEIRVATVSQAAGPALLPANSLNMSQMDVYLRQLYTTAVGQSFASAKSDRTQGSLGMYLWAARSGNSTELFALTCRHVALPDTKFPGNRPYRRCFQGQPANKMIIPATGSWEDWNGEAEILVEECNKSLQSARQDPNVEPVDIQLAELLLRNASGWKRTVDSLQPIDNRVVGEVFFSPPIGKAYDSNKVNPGTFTRDWCLVRMDLSKFPGQQMPQNVVDLRHRDWTQMQMTRLLNPHPQSPHKFTFPEGGLLRLSGVIPMEDLCKPNMLDKNGEECLLVGKRGSASGLTFGTANEIKSVVRVYRGLEDFMSREWLVVGFNKRNAFSKKGDSGSVIFDMHGRVGGLLVAGSLAGSSTYDVTYAIPMAQLLADINEHMGYEVKMV